MEIGYVQSMDFLIQLQDYSGSIQHEIIEAGSEKDAKHKMRQRFSLADFKAGIVVCNIKASGETGKLGDGQLPGIERDIEQVIEECQK